MKAGNSILAAFFFYMAFRIPVEIYNLSLAYDIPDVEFFKVLSVVLFGACIMFGVVSLEYGRESRIKDVITKLPEKKITGLPDSRKNRMADKDIIDKDVPAGAMVFYDPADVKDKKIEHVDKSLPIFEVVDDKDDFSEISANIDNVIRSKE